MMISYRSIGPVALTDSVQGIIRGYIAVWGDPEHRDSYDTWFDKARPPEMALDNGMHRRPIMYEHAQDGTIQKDIIAYIDAIHFDDIGIAYDGHLERSSPFFDRIVTELQAKRLKTSSATMPHTADFYDDGAFRTWILGELSLTASPAEPRMPATILVRSDTGEGRDALQSDGAGSTIETSTNEVRTMNPNDLAALNALIGQYGLDAVMAVLQQMQSPADAEAADQAEDAADAGGVMTAMGLAAAPARGLNLTDVMAELQRRKAAQEQADAMTAIRSQITTLEQRLAQQQAAPPEQAGERFTRGNGGSPAISVSEPRKYWGVDHNALMFGYLALRADRRQVSEEYQRVMAYRAVAALERGDAQMNDMAVRSVMPWTRANEVATSGAANGGADWVTTAWSSQIWAKARNNRIFDMVKQKGMLVEEVPQGASSIKITLESSDPTVYTIAQKTDLAASGRPDVNVGVTRIGTDVAQLTPGELGMAVAWSDVLEEDSIIGILGQYQNQIEQKAFETIEQAFINADSATGASTNINLIDGTPGTGLATPYYIATDGALKYALVTGSSTSRDGGALDENDYRLTMKLMPSAIRTRKSQMAFIIDSDTHSASLDIAAVKTEDVKRTNATIVSGVLTNIYGVDVLESGFMLLANNVGKIPAAGGTLGRILLVYAPFWAMGWKRQITVETDRDILSGTNIIVAKMRLGFKYRGAGASVVSYNLTV